MFLDIFKAVLNVMSGGAVPAPTPKRSQKPTIPPPQRGPQIMQQGLQRRPPRRLY